MAKLAGGGLEVFLAIAEHGSLRAASVALGVRPPAVSHQLKVFEDQIGITLFSRTTRSVELTDAGRILLQRGLPAVNVLRDALEEAREIAKARKGTLKLALSTSAYLTAVAPKLEAFHRLYPDIEISLSLNEALVDIVGEGFHAGIRLGDLIQQDMVAVRLTGAMMRACMATPEYLDKRGRPEHPKDLLAHNCLRTRLIGSNRIAGWRFQGPDGRFTVDVKGNLAFDSFSAVVEAARRGLGIGWSLRPVVEEDLTSGRLQSLLDAYAFEEPGFFLFFPRDNARIEALRVFIDFFKQSSLSGGPKR